MRSRRGISPLLVLCVGGGLPRPLLLAADPGQKTSSRQPVVVTPQQANPTTLLAVGSLMVTPQTVQFHAGNPASMPVVTCDVPVHAHIAIKGTRPSRSWTLTISARDLHLSSGKATIPIDAITWSSSSRPLLGNGTANPATGDHKLSITETQVAGGGQGNRDPFQAHVMLQFKFKDSWAYPVGRYSLTIFFTLTTP